MANRKGSEMMKKRYGIAAVAAVVALATMIGCNGAGDTDTNPENNNVEVSDDANQNVNNKTDENEEVSDGKVEEQLAEVTYVYGTARLTWEQFWANEGVTYDESKTFDAENSSKDAEGVTDLGGFDAVTRATSKHGVYRGSAHYSSLLHATDEAGNAVSVYLEEMTDADTVADMYGAGKNFYSVMTDGVTTYCLTQPESGEYTTYTIADYQVAGYKAWPVKVPESQVEAAVTAINFKQDDTVTEETSLLKTVTIAANGDVTASAAVAANGTVVSYSETPSVSYNDKYGDYIFVQLSNCEPDWGMNLLGAVYEFYGDVNPEENADAAPVATYGTKYAADTWWKSNGKLIQLGINTSYRHGGNGVAGGAEQHGYWRITVMSYGYENYSFVVQSLPSYEAEVSATLGEDNKTLTVTGISEADWAGTAVAVDGVAVEGMENGTAVVEGLAIGSHTVTIQIDGYREITETVVAMSSLTATDITLSGNVLAVNGGEVVNYLANVTGIAVNGTALSGKNLGNVVFSEDGSVNFAAEISGRGGSTVVFPDGSTVSYMLIITSAGYPNVVLNTEVQ